MFTFSPIKQRLDLLCDYVRTEERDGEPMRDDPVVRQRIAQLATQAEVARCLGLRVVAASVKAEKIEGAPPPTVESSQYKLFATEYSRRLADASMDLGAPGLAAAGADLAGRADGGPGRVHLPLHGDRHDRRRRVGDPEERHRPPRAGPPEELLTCRLRIRGPALLDGITVLDLASVGPAARTSRWLADYGATVVKVGPTPKQGGVQITPPFYAYAGHRDMQRALFDLKADAGRDAFLRLAATRRRRDRELPARRRRPARHRVRDRAGGEPGRRLLLDHRLRPGRPVLAVGRPRPQLPRGRRLPRLLRSRRRRRAGAARARRSATAPAAACTR